MNPTIMALALLPLSDPWLTAADRDAFVYRLLHDRRPITVMVDFTVFLQQPGTVRITMGGKVWEIVEPGVARPVLGDVDELVAEFRSRVEAEIWAQVNSDANHDGVVDGEDIPALVAAKAARE